MTSINNKIYDNLVFTLFSGCSINVSKTLSKEPHIRILRSIENNLEDILAPLHLLFGGDVFWEAEDSIEQ